MFAAAGLPTQGHTLPSAELLTLYWRPSLSQELPELPLMLARALLRCPYFSAWQCFAEYFLTLR